MQNYTPPAGFITAATKLRTTLNENHIARQKVNVCSREPTGFRAGKMTMQPGAMMDVMSPTTTIRTKVWIIAMMSVYVLRRKKQCKRVYYQNKLLEVMCVLTSSSNFQFDRWIRDIHLYVYIYGAIRFESCKVTYLGVQEQSTA